MGPAVQGMLRFPPTGLPQLRMASAQRFLHEGYRGQQGSDQSSRSQSMAEVVTLTSGALSWWVFCKTFLFPWQGLAQGCQQLIQVTLQHGLYQ